MGLLTKEMLGVTINRGKDGRGSSVHICKNMLTGESKALLEGSGPREVNVSIVVKATGSEHDILLEFLSKIAKGDALHYHGCYRISRTVDGKYSVTQIRDVIPPRRIRTSKDKVWLRNPNSDQAKALKDKPVLARPSDHTCAQRGILAELRLLDELPFGVIVSGQLDWFAEIKVDDSPEDTESGQEDLFENGPEDPQKQPETASSDWSVLLNPEERKEVREALNLHIEKLGYSQSFANRKASDFVEASKRLVFLGGLLDKFQEKENPNG